MIDKFKFCKDQECDNCGEIIRDEDVEDEELVTSCPFCNWSFIE